ncbi:MAG: Rieske 2Fe-2S domain-containing protein [Betaproteobacteria bacterium]|nr:Rieske 2Fe-2S domain-containing protein [Betaproteobacteria bacterium]
MAEWRCVTNASEILEGRINKARAGNLNLILLVADGEVFAYADACPHEGHALSRGELQADVLICAKHFWEFEIRTGRHVSRVNRPQCNLKPFAARRVADGIEIDVSGSGEAADEEEN